MKIDFTNRASILKKLLAPAIFASLTLVTVSSIHSCGPDEFGSDKPDFEKRNSTGDSDNDDKSGPSKICVGKLKTPISFNGQIEDNIQNGFSLNNIVLDTDPVFRDEDSYKPNYSRLSLKVFAISLYGTKTDKIGGSLRVENSPSSIGFAEDYIGNISISSGMRSDGTVKYLYSKDSSVHEDGDDTPITRFEISVEAQKITSIEITSPIYEQVEDGNGKLMTQYSGKHQRLCVTNTSELKSDN